MFDIKEYNRFEKENKKTKWFFSEQELNKIGAEQRVVSGQKLFRGKYIDDSQLGLFRKGTSEKLNPTFFKFKLGKGLI